MRLWTTQEIGFVDDLMVNGFAYCKVVSEMALDYDYAYEWMAEQMKQRIGIPPMPEKNLPVWAWYQYRCRKQRKPTKSKYANSIDAPCKMMELEVPDKEVLLS